MIFEPQDSPRIFGIPPGCNFSEALVQGLLEKYQAEPPEALARVVIYANTRRAARMLSEAFGARGCLLLPRIRVLSDLADEPLPGVAKGPVPSSLQQMLHLMPAVLALLESDPDLAPRSSVFDLTKTLLDLGKEFEIEGLDLAALEQIDPGTQDLQSHWQTSLTFLTLLTDVLAGDGTGAEARLKQATDMVAARWATNPLRDPVLVVGSTGSRGTTRAFMRAVTALPHGAVVLPGFEFGVSESTRAVLNDDPDHPQNGFQTLAEALGFAWGDVVNWGDTAPANPARNRLLSMALRPAPVTDQWLSEGPELVPELSEAAQGFDLIEAKDERQEALAIALRLREAHARGQSSALITPNRVLARRVTAELSRWNIVPDDSGGEPLHLTPPGIFLRLVVEIIGKPVHPADLLRILKHPLCAASARGAHLAITRIAETKLFAGGPPMIDPEVMQSWWRDLENKPEDGEIWIDWLCAALDQASDLFVGTLPEMTVRHLALAETFAGGIEGDATKLWDKDSGEKSRALLEELDSAGGRVTRLSPNDYKSILRGAMSATEARPEAFEDTKGIAIWGTLEARIQWADTIVLGGLNEGVWPRLPAPDPWLSRKMREAVGLPRAELQIGLSAHDFQQSCGAPSVVLTRAQRSGGEPSVPSRWITRLTSLLDGLGAEGKATLEAMRTRGAVTLKLAQALESPTKRVEPAPRPAPCPPVAARPQRLSVTQIETLIRDPYAIYCAHVLRLRRLNPPGRVPDAMERGNVLHGVLEAFWEAYLRDGKPFTARDFLDTAARAFEVAVPWPVARRRWFARLERIAERFVAEETERRNFALPFAIETKGAREMAGLAQPFKLTARADRIDQMPDGRLAIYDYKAGTIASVAKLRTFAKQLPLEAAIAVAGGFENLPPAEVGKIALLGFSATSKNTTELLDDEIEAEKHWAQLAELIASYFEQDKGYSARLRPQLLASFTSDYEHLSRYGEWSDSHDTVPE